MLVSVGCFLLDVDLERTRRFYETAEPNGARCACDGCQNFDRAVVVLPGEIRAFFESLGVDLRKVCEVYVNCTNGDGTVEYGGFCHLCGTLLAREPGKDKLSGRSPCWYALSPDFRVCFHDAPQLLEDAFPTPVLQLDFLANIPWVLEKENPYPSC